MSKRMTRYPSDRKVYVGDLGSHARKDDLEHAFSAYGTLRSVWVARNPPGFAFVEFEDARDAADSVRGLDGRTVCGRRIRVELSTGKYGSGGAGSGRSDRRGGSRGRGRQFNPEDKCYECGGRGHYARDCRRYGTKRRKYSRSRSRSYSRDNRTRSRTGSRSQSVSRSRSKSRSRSRSVEMMARRDSGGNDARMVSGSDRYSKENGHRHDNSGDERNGGSRSPKQRRYKTSRTPRRSRSREPSKTRQSKSYSRHASRSRSHSHSRRRNGD